MEILTDRASISQWSLEHTQAGRHVGLVPTMGALHAGHLSLVQASRDRDPVTLASIFVNPLQFGPNEDYARYPRSFADDCDLLRRAGVAAVFAPQPEQMYPPDFTTGVEVEGISSRLCGASRPGHFRGVATVVLKLLNLSRAGRAYFGQKDAAQVAVLKRMVRDLNLPVELVVCPVIRDPDGLAMSSRNAYLSPEERHSALGLSRALLAIATAMGSGEQDAERLLTAGRSVLEQTPNLRIDYLAAVDSESLLPRDRATPGTLFAVAAWVGTTRLIDNLLV